MKIKKYFLLFVHGKGAGKPSDEECIKKIIAGEEEYFSVLVKHYRSELFRYTSSYIHNRQQCEDIVQDVFTDFVLLLRSGNYSEQGKVHNLLVKMAHHHVVNYMEHLHLNKALFTQPTDDFDLPVEEDEETYKPEREKMLRIRDALRTVKEKPLSIFMLRHHGKSFEEIGKKLNMKPHTAMTIHTRTMSKLRQAVNGQG